MLFLFCQYREKKSGKDVRLKDEPSQSVNGHKEFSNGKSSEVGKKASQSSRKLRSGKSLGQVMHIISQCFVHFSLFLSVYFYLFYLGQTVKSRTTNFQRQNRRRKCVLLKQIFKAIYNLIVFRIWMVQSQNLTESIRVKP